MENNYVASFSALDISAVNVAGGKGASLAEMYNNDLGVPNGFVVLASAFQDTIATNGLEDRIQKLLKQVDVDAPESLNNISKQIEELILNLSILPAVESEIYAYFKELNSSYVAVRSSTTSEDSQDTSWAGQMSTFLNVQQEDVIVSVKKCWASLYRPNALVYHAYKQEGENTSIAVVVMQMIDPDTAGVGFSVHPVTQDHSSILIEACYGLGEALVSGEVTPDRYQVSKDSLQVVESVVGRQGKKLVLGANGKNEWRTVEDEQHAKVDDIDVLRLAKQIIKVENHYGFPVDVEWAYKDGELFILQSRPITTLEEKTAIDSNKGMFQFSWEELHSVISAESWLNGYLYHKNIVGNNYEKVVMNVSKGIVTTYNAIHEVQITAHEEGKKVMDRQFLEEHLRGAKENRKAFQSLYVAKNKIDLSKASTAELHEMLKDYQQVYNKTWAYFKVSQPEYLECAHQRLAQLLEQEFGKDMQSNMITLTTPDEIDLIKEEEITALEVSLEGAIEPKTLIEYSYAFPWLFFNTYNRKVIIEFLQKKFEDLLQLTEEERRSHISHIRANIDQQVSTVTEILREVSDKNRDEIEYLSKLFRRLAVDRLKNKSWWGGAEYLFLDLFEEIARRMGLSIQDLMMGCSFAQMAEFLEKGTIPAEEDILTLKKHYVLYLSRGKVQILQKEDASIFLYNKIQKYEQHEENSSSIKGVSANMGRVRGVARIIPTEGLERLMSDMKTFKEGEIMVTTMTQPTMLSIARKSGGIVTDEGGITSHASILAREFGIPCVVGTHIGTKRIKDGDVIDVDGNKGEVYMV